MRELGCRRDVRQVQDGSLPGAKSESCRGQPCLSNTPLPTFSHHYVTVQYHIFMGKATGIRPQGRPQNEQVNRRLLAAAFELVAEVGQEAMSIAEVARRAGTTTPAVYRRYRDKEALLTAVVDRELAAIESEPADTGSLRGDLIETVRATVAALTPARARVLAGLVLAADAHRAPARRLSDALRQTTEDAFARVVEKGMLRGEIHSARAPELLARIPGAIVMNMALLRDDPLSEDQITGLVDQIMLPALTSTANGHTETKDNT